MIYVVFAVAWVLLMAMWILAIASARRASHEEYEAVGRSRIGTIWLVVLTGWLGALYYWAVIRRDLEPPIGGAAEPAP